MLDGRLGEVLGWGVEEVAGRGATVVDRGRGSFQPTIGRLGWVGKCVLQHLKGNCKAFPSPHGLSIAAIAEAISLQHKHDRIPCDDDGNGDA